MSAAFTACRSAFIGVAILSGILNVLYLTGSFFMLEVYDRVLPSHSVPTLVGISILALILFSFQGILDIIRSRILVRIARSIDETVSQRVYEASVRLQLLPAAARTGQPLRDFDQFRSFMSTVGPAALFDLPWIPLYLGICYLFHPWLGITVTAGALILVVFTILTELKTRVPTRDAARFGYARSVLTSASERNVEAVQAMGMLGRLSKRWAIQNSHYQAAQQTSADVAGGFGGLSKFLRTTLQSGVLALGAYLVINQQATGGIIIASSIIASRALAPVELAVAHWKGFISARQSWGRLKELLVRLPTAPAQMDLPRPTDVLSLQGLSVAPPGMLKPVVQDVTFQLQAGQAVGVIGPSASGKSSLVRALVGVWTPLRGQIRVDGATLDQWSPETLGTCIGYLPQDMELFGGTVGENISRFEEGAPAEAIIATAKAAGVHELILGLPRGYETEIGESGASLSVGQRQRIGLARALYGEPFLVVLDEPNSSLDSEGEEALTRAILGVRARGGIVVVVAHRPSALAAVNHVLVLQAGRQQSFGLKEVVLKAALQPRAATSEPTPLRVAGRSAEAAV